MKIVSAAVVAAVVASVFSASVQADQINIRMGSGHPIGLLAYTGTASNFFAPELKKRIEERTDHTVQVLELHSGQVAKVTEVLESTRDGLLDIGFISMVFEPSELFMHNFPFFLPFGSPDSQVASDAARATYAAHPELAQIFEDKYKQKLLGVSCLSNYGLGTTFAWEDVSELKGVKIAGAGVNLDWLAAIGTTPVASNLNDAYQSMQTGVYEGYISAATWWSTFKLNEVAPNFTKTDFGAMPTNAATINLKTWNKLPNDVKEIMQEVAREWEDVTAEVCARNDKEGLQKLRDLDVNVTELKAETRQKWGQALKDFPNKMAQEGAKKGLPVSAVMRTYMSELKKRGYEFPYEYEIN